MGLSRDPLDSLKSTAFCVGDSRAAIAYRVDLQERGPNGENSQGFVIETFDGGQSWFPVTLACTIGSRLWFWGYPVWPPEEILEIVLVGGRLGISFHDAEVPFEPGGESAWRATRSRLGAWRVKRVREMNYQEGELEVRAGAIAVHLPENFSVPPQTLVHEVARNVALQSCPGEPIGFRVWLPMLPLGLVAAYFGSSLELLATLVLYLVSWIGVSHLKHRRQMRALCVLSERWGGR